MPDRASIGHSRDRNSDRAHLLLAQNRNKMRCRRPAKPVWHSRCASNFCLAFRFNAPSIRISRSRVCECVPLIRDKPARITFSYRITRLPAVPRSPPANSAKTADSRHLRFSLFLRARFSRCSFIFRETDMYRSRASHACYSTSHVPHGWNVYKHLHSRKRVRGESSVCA